MQIIQQSYIINQTIKRTACKNITKNATFLSEKNMTNSFETILIIERNQSQACQTKRRETKHIHTHITQTQHANNTSAHSTT